MGQRCRSGLNRAAATCSSKSPCQKRRSLIQAVGRLIRTETDYGRVTILDNRLLRQAYGKKLLAALPPFRRL